MTRFYGYQKPWLRRRVLMKNHGSDPFAPMKPPPPRPSPQEQAALAAIDAAAQAYATGAPEPSKPKPKKQRPGRPRTERERIAQALLDSGEDFSKWTGLAIVGEFGGNERTALRAKELALERKPRQK